MKKADHLKFLELFDKAALLFGAEKFIYREATPTCTAPQLDGYRFQTIYGELVLHPDKPWRIEPSHRGRLKYTVDVFGRFKGDGPYPESANKFSGKWNFHYGAVDEHQLEYCVDNIMFQVRNILPLSIDTKSRP